MKTEENKRMLALSCIVADLKAENIELEQRVHHLEDDYNDVAQQLRGTEKRKELWRKERLRQDYGLERKTALNIPVNPLSHKASAQKHAMIKACNYFADPLGDPRVICYDSQTKRSARRKTTAERYGIRVVEGDD